MKTLRMTIWSLSALIIFLTASQSMAGTSNVRIRAKVRTPQVRVDVRTPVRCGNGYVKPRTHGRRHHHISQQDRRIATRLANYTDISRYEILDLRDRGYRWSEIARYFELPRKMMRAAQSSRSWRAYQKPRHWCGTHLR